MNIPEEIILKFEQDIKNLYRFRDKLFEKDDALQYNTEIQNLSALMGRPEAIVILSREKK
jgi:hypothetical protein